MYLRIVIIMSRETFILRIVFNFSIQVKTERRIERRSL